MKVKVFLLNINEKVESQILIFNLDIKVLTSNVTVIYKIARE